ncbi:hypothetical protein ACQI4F_19910 [Mycolicibacterium vaccae]|uniref:hypothetical protein n=1 Tax=Mycolicibacterium vaccae TaxID=1810 RepID=UPI003CF45DCD
MTPRESILLRGLADWVALDRIHSDVSESKPGAPLITIQDATLTLIHDLVEEGLFEVGEVSDERGFSPWNEPLDVDGFDKQNIWPWYCWLDLTDKGEQLAQRIQSTPSTG